jgi:phage terminase large subunit-like protein
VNAVPPWLAALAGLEEHRLSRMLRNAPAPIRRRLFEEWFWQAHSGQREPDGEWRTWLIMAGRGFGKTRAGAEWVLARAREVEGARIALVGATIEEVVKVMIEGESGLKAAARTGEEVRWVPSRSIVELPGDAIGLPYSGARPAKLRGPQHHFAWCDEIAKWRLPDDSWDNLMLGLRLGLKPRVVVTTTPQPIPLLKRIQRLNGTVTTGGRTADNVHLPADFVDAVTEAYGGTRLGRQELDGVYLEEREGALWTRALIEQCRTGPRPGPDPQAGEGELARIVIGVDPPAGVNGTCGIVVAGLARDGMAYVLSDASVQGLTPERWADAVARAADAWRADRVIAEANQGGAMVETVLRAVEQALPVKLRHASEAKGKRAEPVAALFEAGRARFAGSFPELEDQLVQLMPGGGYALAGSPDRADAMVWGLSELMLGARREPRIRAL